jgi:hypothetical protein
VRHEIIALYSACSEGGAQFYPGCHQLQVSGEGTKMPGEGLVSFPGAYDGREPGIMFSITISCRIGSRGRLCLNVERFVG